MVHIRSETHTMSHRCTAVHSLLFSKVLLVFRAPRSAESCSRSDRLLPSRASQESHLPPEKQVIHLSDTDIYG
jgi:hypothetical protein